MSLGVKFATPIFDGASKDEIEAKVQEAGLPDGGHTYLFDGETGDRFHQKATWVYHLYDETAPYGG
jgi:DNA-directed RNA polymerase subunit beta